MRNASVFRKNVRGWEAVLGAVLKKVFLPGDLRLGLPQAIRRLPELRFFLHGKIPGLIENPSVVDSV